LVSSTAFDFTRAMLC